MSTSKILVFIKNLDSKSAADCIVSSDEKFNFHYEMHKKYKMPLSAYPQLKSKECIARHAHSFIIGANGDLFKCFDDIGKAEKVVGNLNNKSFNQVLYNRYIVGADALSDRKCISCKLFPICSGGCPMLRLENEKAGKEIYNLCSLMKDAENKILSLHLEQKEGIKLK